jgi:hypothetical protein
VSLPALPGHEESGRLAALTSLVGDIMPLFSTKRYVWNEPWFFQQRIRTATSWVLFALLLLGIALVLGVVLYLLARAGRPISWTEIIALPLGAAAAVWWLLDGTESRRQAILFEDSIVVGGDMGKYSTPTTYKLNKIPGAVIVLPEESKWPAPGLYFHYDGQEQVIGIEAKASLIRLAQALHDAGVAVRLDGWQPDQDNEFERVFSWQADPAQVTARATMQTLPAGTPSMMTPGGIVLAIIQQSWAILLWLAITGWAIYYGYQNWGNLGVVRLAFLIILSIATMYLAGQYTERIASAATSDRLTRMALGQIRKRDGLQLDPDGELVPVEVLDREFFDKAIQKIREMGFLQADAAGGRMLFEGKKERWEIPVAAIRSVAIEEVQSGTPGQSATGALNYYVVVRFMADDEQELGFRYGGRDYGEFNDIKRAEGAIRVYEAFETLLPEEEVTPARATEASC